MAVNVTAIKDEARTTFVAALKTAAVAAWGGVEADYEDYAASMGDALAPAIDVVLTRLLEQAEVDVTGVEPGIGTAGGTIS